MFGVKCPAHRLVVARIDRVQSGNELKSNGTEAKMDWNFRRNGSEQGEVLMRHFLSVAATGAVALTVLASTFTPAYSQTRPASPPSSASPPGAAAGQAAPAAAGVKRADCRAAALSLRGEKQDRVDQYQLCMVQARMDCLKEAIAKKVVEREQRRDYIKNCIGNRDEDNM
jgi:hypothetical protein